MPRRSDHQAWIPAEDVVLREHYGKMRVKDLHSLLPGRTRAAVAGRLIKLRLRVPKEPDWSEAELSLLREQFGRVSPRKLAKTLGRSQEAVKLKGNRSGLKARKRRLTPRAVGDMMHICSKKVKRWIEKGLLKAEVLYRGPHRIHAVQPEDLAEFLKAHPEQWDARRCPDLHIKLGIKSKRSGAAVDERPLWLKEKLAADIRRRRSNKRWTPTEDLQLAQLFRQGLPYQEIGKRVGRSGVAIDHRVQRLGKRIWEILKQGSA